MTISKLNNIFESEMNYTKINKIGTVKMRNCNNGIKLSELILYRFLYSKKDTTKERAVAIVNNKIGTNFTRQGFDSKERNIPIQTYINVLNKVTNYYDKINNLNNDSKIIAIDGTYNNDPEMNEVLNMGFYDVTNDIPISIEFYGKQNKNREIYAATDYIKNNMSIFKDNIIVADRAYFSYNFLNFLISNGLKFIIRTRGEAKGLNLKGIKTNTPKYNEMLYIKNNSKIIKYENNLKKTVYSRKKNNSKKSSIAKYILDIKNDCVIITNLLDEKIYSNDKIMELYRSRWNIEVFFKLIKSNYKFQHIKEKLNMGFQKMYICELIITYIAKIIETYYRKKYTIRKKEGYTFKINKSNLIDGIFDSIIYYILENKLTNQKLNIFCNNYIKIIQNKNDRTYPRTAKKPFTKWYIKGYSELTKYMKIIKAIINNKIDELNKNLKTIAKKILSINGKKYNT